MKDNNNLVQQYAEAQQRVRNLLAEFDQKLEAHKNAFAKSGGKDWGYFGDMALWAERLEEMLGKRG